MQDTDTDTAGGVAATRLESLYRPLWLTYGLVPLLAGLDKFFDVLADWSAYLSPAVAGQMPMTPDGFMAFVGVVEVAAGCLVLTQWTRIGAWIVAAWLCVIAVNLVSMGLYDIAVRDVAMAVGAATLARLAALRDEVAAPAAESDLAEQTA